MALFKPWKGNLSNLGSATKAEGKVYFTQDTGNLYIDASSSTRFKVADTTEAILITLKTGAWSASGGNYTYTYSFNSNITSLYGKRKEYPSPPFILCVDSDLTNYKQITSAQISLVDNTNQKKMYFTAKTKPTANINLLIIYSSID